MKARTDEKERAQQLHLFFLTYSVLVAWQLFTISSMPLLSFPRCLMRASLPLLRGRCLLPLRKMASLLLASSRRSAVAVYYSSMPPLSRRADDLVVLLSLALSCARLGRTPTCACFLVSPFSATVVDAPSPSSPCLCFLITPVCCPRA